MAVLEVHTNSDCGFIVQQSIHVLVYRIVLFGCDAEMTVPEDVYAFRSEKERLMQWILKHVK